MMNRRYIIAGVVLIALVVGLVVATRLTQIQQIFKSRASSNEVPLRDDMKNGTVYAQHVQWIDNAPGHYKITGTVTPHAGGKGIIQVDIYNRAANNSLTFASTVAGVENSGIDKEFDIAAGQSFAVIDRATQAEADFKNVTLQKLNTANESLGAELLPATMTQPFKQTVGQYVVPLAAPGRYSVSGQITKNPQCGEIKTDIETNGTWSSIPLGQAITIYSTQHAWTMVRAKDCDVTYANFSVVDENKSGAQATYVVENLSGSVKVGQKELAITQPGTYELNATMDKSTCGVVQADMYLGSVIRTEKKTGDAPLRFTVKTGETGHAILRANNCDTNFSNATLKKVSTSAGTSSWSDVPLVDNAQNNGTDVKNTTVSAQNVQWFTELGKYHITGTATPHPGGTGIIQVDVYTRNAQKQLVFKNTVAQGTVNGSIDKTFDILPGEEFAVINRASISEADFKNVTLTKEILLGSPPPAPTAPSVSSNPSTPPGPCVSSPTTGDCPIPMPAGVNYPVGKVVCETDNRATFKWKPFVSPGLTVSFYELRINADGSSDPEGWAPDVNTTPANQPVGERTPGSGPDRVLSVPANQTEMTVQLNKGEYADWVARPHFTDGTMIDIAPTSAGWGHWGPWGCSPDQIPLPTTVSYPNGTVTCDATNKATFAWTPISYPSKTVESYELRINGAPADWKPDLWTDIDQVPPTQSEGTDRVISIPANQSSVTVQLRQGEYLDWVARPHFTDNTMLEIAPTSAGWGHWGAWSCPDKTNPVAATVIKFRVAESIADLDSATASKYKDYTDYQAGKIIDHTFSGDPKVAGIKTLFVRFYYSDNTTEVVQQSLSYVVPPAITGVTCDINPEDPNGTLVKVVGTNLGTEGTIVYGTITTGTITKWTDTEITATYPNQLAGSQAVLVTANGVTKPAVCTLHQTQISVNMALTCKTVNRPPQKAKVEIAQVLPDNSSPFVYTNDDVTFSETGSAQNILPNVKLIPGKEYVLKISSEFTVGRGIPFTASTENTTVIQENPVNLPLGDIAPEGGDDVVNTNDALAFRTQLSQLQNVVRQSDFNIDGRVNSVDWACLRSNISKFSQLLPQNTTKNPSGGVCTTDADCATGNSCLAAGASANKICRKTAGAADGASCVADSDCKDARAVCQVETEGLPAKTCVVPAD